MQKSIIYVVLTLFLCACGPLKQTESYKYGHTQEISAVKGVVIERERVKIRRKSELTLGRSLGKGIGTILGVLISNKNAESTFGKVFSSLALGSMGAAIQKYSNENWLLKDRNGYRYLIEKDSNGEFIELVLLEKDSEKVIANEGDKVLVTQSDPPNITVIKSHKPYCKVNRYTFYPPNITVIESDKTQCEIE